ncbi:hypothetical protein TNIN_349041 [Trichonephila inaurata madagascariensis]|uniref:Uncharacterized protein n=1 Tax=Trichonephila inaurata madagascariensis TaxID=2747483 RepID=A0A8X6Y1D4_9ARAC|nr:hypothetical protein TNIN_349041 [Trichonephila inaurata madagascariensis]
MQFFERLVVCPSHGSRGYGQGERVTDFHENNLLARQLRLSWLWLDSRGNINHKRAGVVCSETRPLDHIGRAKASLSLLFAE